MCDLGFPLDDIDICYLVKSYLDRKGAKESQFEKYLPNLKSLFTILKRNTLR